MNTTESKPALLVMDVQSGITSRLENGEAYVASVEKAVAYAHSKNIPVIFVVVGFREGLPEISPSNKMFSGMREHAAAMINPSPAIAPAGADVVVTKRRVSAFSGSDLEVIVRAKGIEHMILCGVATSGVVLSTLREAADKDYQITVLSDLCRDMDEEVNKVLLEKIFPRQADVIASAEWMK